MKYPEDCNLIVSKLVEKTVLQTREVLGENLLNITLHGSLAMGSYYFPKSDIDVLVIVKNGLASELRKYYFQSLETISNLRETVGDLELSVLQAKSLEFADVSVPYEVHFSERQKANFLSINFSENNNDSDLPAHLMVAYHRGITLYGQKLTDLMDEPSWDLYRKSVQTDLEWILSNENILQTPFYSILNCCRSYLLFVNQEIKIYSKEEAAVKVQEILPSLHDLIQKGLGAYRSDRPVSSQTRRTNNQSWDRLELLKFRDSFRSVFAKHGIILKIE